MFHLSLAAARVNAGMTQKEVAKALSLNANTIKNWETGRTKISAEGLAKVSALYKCPIEYLVAPLPKDDLEGIQRIIVSTEDEEVIADVTARDVICKKGYKVRYI